MSTPLVANLAPMDYATVAVSQTDQVLGANGGTSGAKGDFLAGLLVVPTGTTGVATVSIKDGSGSAIVVYNAPAIPANTPPFFVSLGIKSRSGAWKVTTGAQATVVAVGRFSGNA